MSRKSIKYLTHAAIIAAIYIVLTILAAGFDLASGAIQVRFSEALTVLPYFTPAAIPGVTIGCFLSNLFTGCLPPDVIFGTLATFLGAIGTYFLKKHKYLCPLPPIISNAVIIPQILSRAYHIPGSIPFLMLTVGIGEIISCYIPGLLLLRALEPFRAQLFDTTKA